MTIYSGNLQASLDAASVTSSTTPVNGSGVDLGAITTRYLLYVPPPTGNGIVVSFDGSIDGTAWYPLSAGGSATPAVYTDGLPARYVRANAKLNVSEGSSTVSVFVASAEDN